MLVHLTCFNEGSMHVSADVLQKSPMNFAKEPYEFRKRALYILPKSPTCLCIWLVSMRVRCMCLQMLYKRALCIPPKNPMNSANEPYEFRKRAPDFCEFCKRPLLISQKSPMNFAKNPMNFAIEPYEFCQRDLWILSKSPVNSAKEPYEFCQRALWIPQKSPRPVNVSMRVVSNEIPTSGPSFFVQTSGLWSLKEPSSEALWAQGLRLQKNPHALWRTSSGARRLWG